MGCEQSEPSESQKMEEKIGYTKYCGGQLIFLAYGAIITALVGDWLYIIKGDDLTNGSFDVPMKVICHREHFTVSADIPAKDRWNAPDIPKLDFDYEDCQNWDVLDVSNCDGMASAANLWFTLCIASLIISFCGIFLENAEFIEIDILKKYRISALLQFIAAVCSGISVLLLSSGESNFCSEMGSMFVSPYLTLGSSVFFLLTCYAYLNLVTQTKKLKAVSQEQGEINRPIPDSIEMKTNYI